MDYYYHKDAMHISRIDLTVKDLKRSLDFYLNNLGFSILKTDTKYTSLTSNHNNELIRLYEDKDIEKSNNMNIYHYALLLPNRNSLGKFLRHLIIKQIPIDGAADHKVSEAIYLRDPDGYGIEITCDKDDNSWLYNQDMIEMDTLPFDYRGVYYSCDENEVFSNLPEETIIGHLHLQVQNLEVVTDFYKSIVGFNITNKNIQDAVFLSDKKYHHHLALNSWKKEMLDTKDQPQLKAFTIAYPNCEKFIKTLNHLEKANISFQETQEGILIKDPENTSIYLQV
jgi:catechol 2,3-dioxygenase